MLPVALCAFLVLAAKKPSPKYNDAPGWYRVTHEGAAVTASAESPRGAAKIGRLIQGMEVEVLEVTASADGERIRARIEKPVAGWMTLGYSETAKNARKAGYRWAVPMGKKAAAGAKKKASTSRVLVGTDDNFFKFRREPLVVACFYLPGQKASSELLANLETAAEALEGQITFVKVDVEEEADITAEVVGEGYDSRRLPVILAFMNGQTSRYDGPRDADGIIQYMKRVLQLKASPAMTEVTTSEDLEKLQGQDLTAYAVAYLPEKGTKEDKAWAAVADKLKAEFTFARSYDAGLAKAEGVRRPGIKMYRRGRESINYRGGIADAEGGQPGDAVVRWLRTSVLPPFGEITQKSLLAYTLTKDPIMWLFLDPSDQGGETKDARDTFARMASESSSNRKMRFVWSDATQGMGRQVAQKLGAYEKEGDVSLTKGVNDIGRLPAVALTRRLSPTASNPMDAAVFPYADHGGIITEEGLRAWVTSRETWLKGSAEQDEL